MSSSLRHAKTDPMEDPRVVWWKVRYADGTKWTPADGTWANAPTAGVLWVIIWRKDRMRRIMCGRSWYWQDTSNFPNVFGQTSNADKIRGTAKTGARVTLAEWLKAMWEAYAEIAFVDPPESNWCPQ